MILNNDGTPYKLKGSLVQFDPNNPDHALFNLWDQEAIKIGGSPIFYYEVFIQTQTVDRTYNEDRGKLFSPVHIQLYAYYEPPQQSSPSTLFGIDAPQDEVIFELNYEATLQTIGHPPKRGSRIYTPHRQENWIIVDIRLAEFKMWSIMRIQLLCQKYQESLTTGEGQVTQDRPDFEIIG
jgi:hypothetical protein